MHTNSKQGAMTYWRRVVVNVSCCHFEELMTYKPRSWFRRSCILVAIGRVTFAILGSGSRETKLCYHWSGTFALYTHCRSVHLYVAKNLFVRERELVFMESDLVTLSLIDHLYECASQWYIAGDLTYCFATYHGAALHWRKNLNIRKYDL